jgi:hypothetical protein
MLKKAQARRKDEAEKEQKGGKKDEPERVEEAEEVEEMPKRARQAKSKPKRANVRQKAVERDDAKPQADNVLLNFQPQAQPFVFPAAPAVPVPQT